MVEHDDNSISRNDVYAELSHKPLEFQYHLLRRALHDHGKNIARLDAAEYEQVQRKADKSFELETLVITSQEARGIVIPAVQIQQALEKVSSRYTAREEFLDDLAYNGMDEAVLRKALYRELLFDAVMQRVSANAPNVNNIDVRLFYEMHYERFMTPELRVARHILITVNPDYAENSEYAAAERIEQLVNKLAGRVNRFPQFAKRYSECPTAMEGGKLGDVRSGQLFPELDSMLFSMEAGQISPVVQSEMGFHILLCEKIKPAKRIPFTKVDSRIRESLEERQRRNGQKRWLSNLRKSFQ